MNRCPKIIALLTALGLAALLTAQGAPQLVPISNIPHPGSSGDGPSFNPRFSSDGLFVAFTSSAVNLVTNDNRSLFLDLFLRNLASNTTELISVSSTGEGGADDHIYEASLSSNAQRIAFSSAASNLVPGDNNHAADIYIRDRNTATTTLASLSWDGLNQANGKIDFNGDTRLSRSPLLSADGTKVLFVSNATNLVTVTDTNHAADIYLRDLAQQTNSLISVSSGGASTGNGASHSPSITPNLRFVAFVSGADDLTPSAPPGVSDVYLRDLEAETTRWISHHLTNLLSEPYLCLGAVISDSGETIAFKACHAVSQSPAILIHHDITSDTSIVVSTNVNANDTLALSAGGNTLTYEEEDEVWIWQAATESATLVTAGFEGPARSPAISADGNTIALVASGTNGQINFASPLFQLFTHDLMEDVTRLVTRSTNGNPGTAHLDATLPSLSPNGDRIAFQSPDGTLTAEDFNLVEDIFLYHHTNESIELLSARTASRPADTSPALTLVRPRSLSADGQFLLFSGHDNTLVPMDTNGIADLMVRDLASGETRAIGVPAGGYPGWPAIESPAISADGNYVILVQPSGSVSFGAPLEAGRGWRVNWRTGESRPLVGGGPPYNLDSPRISSDGRWVAMDGYIEPGGGNIFLQEMNTGETFRLRNPSSPSTNTLFTPDDRWLIFHSGADRITTNVVFAQGRIHLYAWDLQSIAKFRFISWETNGINLAASSFNPHVSGNSRYVAFEVPARSQIYRHDLQSNSINQVLCQGCHTPRLNHDGNLLLHEANSGSGIRDITLRNLDTGTATLVSQTPAGAGGNGDSSDAQFTKNDRFVLFASQADNLVEMEDNNGASDIFLRDLINETTLLVSINHLGTGAGNGPSLTPVLSRDGQTVAFQSLASDLVPNDLNHTGDVFLLRLNDGDQDDDGLEDDWEMTFFSSLDRDGTGDFDNDGHSDHDEFQAGTNPTDDTSILRVITLTTVGLGTTTVLWSSVPGKTYEVQVNSDLNSLGWDNLPGQVTATGTTSSLIDSQPAFGGKRYYRVRLLPSSN